MKYFNEFTVSVLLSLSADRVNSSSLCLTLSLISMTVIIQIRPLSQIGPHGHDKTSEMHRNGVEKLFHLM